MEEYKGKKVILHLCCKAGSETRYFQLDDNYVVIKITEEIGVENYNIPEGMVVYGVYGNPPCTNFTTVDYSRNVDTDQGMFLVNHCLRIIEQAKERGGLKWHVLENPSRGTLKKLIGEPVFKYTPWEYGASFTKATALWGEFNPPKKTILDRKDVIINEKLYIRARDTLPSLVLLHKSAIHDIDEWAWAKKYVDCDADIRALSCDGYSKAFYEANK